MKYLEQDKDTKVIVYQCSECESKIFIQEKDLDYHISYVAHCQAVFNEQEHDMTKEEEDSYYDAVGTEELG
jgi:DNA-directed RNA polymerase subunit RPC12/RpoP